MVKELNDNDFIVSKTDTKGRITYTNKIFMEMAEYTEEELLGKTPQYHSSSSYAKGCL